MNARNVLDFDIFKVTSDGHPMWTEAAESLHDAKQRIESLGQKNPGEYIIFNQRTGEKLSVKVSKGRVAGHD